MSEATTGQQVPHDTPVGVPTGVIQSLTGRKLAFAREYLIDRNATAAYIRAGYAPKGANKRAGRVLADPDVQAYIAAAEAQAAKRSAATIERLELELERIALADPRKLYRPDGSIKPPSEWDDDTAATIAATEVEEEFDGSGEDRVHSGNTRKVKCWDKVRALIELLKRRDEAAKAPPPPVAGSSADSPIHVQHSLSPDALRSFLADLRGAGLAATGMGNVSPDGH